MSNELRDSVSREKTGMMLIFRTYFDNMYDL